jgi:hypothetical protein
LPLPASGAREVKSRFGCHSANGRDAVAPLPAVGKAATERGNRGPGRMRGGHKRPEAEVSRARLGWHAERTLPEAEIFLSGNGA